MNRKDAKIIATTITDAQIEQMLINAKNSITDWKQPSKVNKSITKGTAWNVLTHGLLRHPISSMSLGTLAKRNIVHEFGDYLPEELKLVKIKPKKGDVELVHQAPEFGKLSKETLDN